MSLWELLDYSRIQCLSSSRWLQPMKITSKMNCDSDILRQCPYDRNHRVRSSRFEIHLVKCRKVSLTYSFTPAYRHYTLRFVFKELRLECLPVSFQCQAPAEVQRVQTPRVHLPRQTQDWLRAVGGQRGISHEPRW